MGWASYVEDITDRLTRNLRDIDLSQEIREKSEIDQAIQRLQQVRASCIAYLEELRKLAELATDPDIEIYGELLKVRTDGWSLRRGKDALEASNRKLQADLGAMKGESDRKLQELDGKLKATERKLREERKLRKKADSQLEKMASSDKGAFAELLDDYLPKNQ